MPSFWPFKKGDKKDDKDKSKRKKDWGWENEGEPDDDPVANVGDQTYGSWEPSAESMRDLQEAEERVWGTKPGNKTAKGKKDNEEELVKKGAGADKDTKKKPTNGDPNKKAEPQPTTDGQKKTNRKRRDSGAGKTRPGKTGVKEADLDEELETSGEVEDESEVPVKKSAYAYQTGTSMSELPEPTSKRGRLSDKEVELSSSKGRRGSSELSGAWQNEEPNKRSALNISARKEETAKNRKEEPTNKQLKSAVVAHKRRDSEISNKGAGN